jgi:Na+/proline symporter
VLQGTHGDLPTADAAAPQFLQFHAHPLLAGLVFAGLFAAIMSTADAFLNIGTAAVIHDIPRALRARPLKHELFWARVGTCIIGLAAGAFALYCGSQSELVALLGAFGWGTFAAALVPTVAIGFNWKRATPLAANVAIIVSLLVNIGIKVLELVFDVEILPYGFHGYTVSLLLSISLFFGISLASKPPRLDPDVEALMDI